MRIALVTEATYPYLRSGVSAWCHQLCAGLPQHAFEVVTVTAAPGGRTAYRPPASVTAVRAIPVTERPAPPAGRTGRNRHRRDGTAAAVLLCRGLLGDGPHEAAMFRDGLRQLAALAAGGHPLHGVPLPEILTDAWRAAAADPRRRAPRLPPRLPQPHLPLRRLPLPRLSLRDAEGVADLLDHAIRPLAAPPPSGELTHAVGAGLPLLVALAAKWRGGAPFLLTEHGIYLRDQYLAGGGGRPPAGRTAMLRFYRALSRLGYAEAAVIAPVSRFNRRWELRHGADPAKVVIVPNGVDPAGHPPLPEIDGPPTLGWVGRIGAGTGLRTVIEAFDLVRRRVPGARLRVSGPVADGQEGYADGCRELIRRLNLRDAVTLTGPIRTSAEAYARSHVAAPSTVAGGAPYTVIEAMMCGRATVAADVGAAAEVLGDAGVVVPSGDPEAFAAACARLLTDRSLRQRLAAAGRRRAVDNFTVDRMLNTYDALYRSLGAPVLPGTAAGRAPAGVPG